MTADIHKAWLYTVHNKFLLIWSETGFFGMTAFLWFLAASLRAAWHASYSRDPLSGPLAFGLTAALLAHNAHMLVDVFNDRPLVQLLCFVAGLVAGIYASHREEARRYHEARPRIV
jgi:O-antigen ligase